MRIGGQGESSSVFNEALPESSNCSVESRRPSISKVSRSESRCTSSIGTDEVDADLGMIMGLIFFASASYRSLSPAPDKVGTLLIPYVSKKPFTETFGLLLILKLDGFSLSIRSELWRRSMAKVTCADNLATSAKEISQQKSRPYGIISPFLVYLVRPGQSLC